MMLKRLLLIASLISTSVCLAEGQISPKAAQESGQLKTELTQTLNTLPKDLASEKQRYELAATVNLLLAKRMEANFRGYEKDPEFQKKFLSIYKKFLESLKSNPVPVKAEDANKFIEYSNFAYEKNEEEFTKFYNETVRTDPQLGKLSLEEAGKTLFQFSAWLYVMDRDTWNVAKRITYLSPWCRVDSTLLDDKKARRK